MYPNLGNKNFWLIVFLPLYVLSVIHAACIRFLIAAWAPTSLPHKEGQVQKSIGLTTPCSLCLETRGVDKAFTKGESEIKTMAFLIQLRSFRLFEELKVPWEGSKAVIALEQVSCYVFWTSLWTFILGYFSLLHTERIQKCILNGLSEQTVNQKKRKGKGCLQL